MGKFQVIEMEPLQSGLMTYLQTNLGSFGIIRLIEIRLKIELGILNLFMNGVWSAG